MSALTGDETIGVDDLKTHLCAVLEEVIAGLQVTIQGPYKNGRV